MLNTRARRRLRLVALGCIAGALASCSASPSTESSTAAASSTTTTAQTPLEKAQAENRAHKTDARFGESPIVVADDNFSGISASQLFFPTSETLVISGPSISEQLRAASLAVASHAPMVRFTGSNSAYINQEVERLKVSTVLIVGNAPDPVGDRLTVIKDPGTFEAVGELTSRQFERQEVATIEQIAAATAALDSKSPVLLSAEFEAMPVFVGKAGVQSKEEPTSASLGRTSITAGNGEAESVTTKDEGVRTKVPSFPAQSATDGGAAPIIVASPQTSIAAIATARAFGAPVRVMDYHDPRFNEQSLFQVAGLSDKPLIALGSQYGTAESFADLITRAEKQTFQFPGGGGLVFPGRRMIAYYGHPSGPALGVLGENPPEQAVENLKALVAEYQPLSDEPVIPAFEIIATVASASPDNGDYSAETNIEDLIPTVDAIIAAGGYAVIDLQPGRARLVDQARMYEELLKRPEVGLALDPEWKLGPDETPLNQIGHVDAEEVNEVAEYLAGLIDEHNLPQKTLILHQFQLQMIRNRENIRLDYPQLAFVIHADGHGVPAEKMDTFNALLQDLDPRFFIAWKNFIDEDTPTFSPQETYNITPRPYFVSYQ